MTERPDYTAADLTVVTLREAVLRRPGMYFGSFAATDWPLVILAWTVLDLLELAPADSPRIQVTVRSNGRFDASVRRGSLVCPARAQTAADAVRLRQWWTQLCRDVTITIGGPGQALALENVPTGDFGRRMLADVDIAVAASVDSDVVSAPPATWWPSWLDRLPDVLHRLGSELTPGQQIVAADEASGTRRVLAA
jgi:hypothetical protein